MKLFVLGATGGTGRPLVEQALARGHEVTALVRRPAALPPAPHLSLVQGDVFDHSSFVQHLQGHDAVLSALGPSGRSLGPTTLYTRSTEQLLAAMAQTQITRLIAVTSGGVVEGAAPFWFRPIKPFFKFYADMKKMETQVMASDTDWTLVRPGYLTDARVTGCYRTAVDAGSLPRGWRISRADVAHFMLEMLEQNQFVRQAVAMAY